MKKTAAILLLGLFLFNWFGYRLLTYYAEDRANQDIEAQLDDNEYDESQLISIKSPVTHLAYYHNSPEFERVNGTIELEGIQYKYVKRRIFNDSLEILCIPDEAAIKFQLAKNNFFAFNADLQHSGQGRKHASSDGIKFFSPDGYPVQDLQMADDHFALSTKKYYDPASLIISPFFPVAAQPPDGNTAIPVLGLI